MATLYELSNDYLKVLSLAEELDDGTLKDTLALQAFKIISRVIMPRIKTKA